MNKLDEKIRLLKLDCRLNGRTTKGLTIKATQEEVNELQERSGFTGPTFSGVTITT